MAYNKGNELILKIQLLNYVYMKNLIFKSNFFILWFRNTTIFICIQCRNNLGNHRLKLIMYHSIKYRVFGGSLQIF